jgi:hypothetical protein
MLDGKLVHLGGQVRVGERSPPWPTRAASGVPSSRELLGILERKSLRYLDLIPRESLIEKIVYLLLEEPGPWRGVGPIFDRLVEEFHRYSTEAVRTVIFGGGSGLSGIVGGDTSLETWARAPFHGMKRYFPNPVLDAFYTGNATKHAEAGLLQDYYAWEWGDALFVVLDPYWFNHSSIGQCYNRCVLAKSAFSHENSKLIARFERYGSHC